MNFRTKKNIRRNYNSQSAQIPTVALHYISVCGKKKKHKTDSFSPFLMIDIILTSTSKKLP